MRRSRRLSALDLFAAESSEEDRKGLYHQARTSPLKRGLLREITQCQVSDVDVKGRSAGSFGASAPD